MPLIFCFLQDKFGRTKNKSGKRRDSKGKLKKVETPKSEHSETIEKLEKKDVHANHVEVFNSAIRRYLSAFLRRTNVSGNNGIRFCDRY